MHVNWSKVIGVVGRVGGAVLTGVPAVEQLSKTFGGKSGEEKATAVLDLALAELHAASLVAGRDLSLDPGVVEVVRRIVGDVADLHNAVAKASHGAGV